VSRTGDGARRTVDLYLAPEALWVLKIVRPAQVRRVISHDGPVLNEAERLGLEILSGDVNRLAFEPAPVGLSVHYPLRIGPEVLFGYRVLYNLHPGYLPWCRGLSSVNWALWEGSPAGATLHEMTAELDAGPIVDRIEVEHGPDDLCGEVQQRVTTAEKRLLGQYWPRIAAGESLAARPQDGPGSAHTHRETAQLLRRLKKEAGWRALDAPELVAALRSFGTLEIEHGRRVLRLHLTARPSGFGPGGDDPA